MEQPPTPDRRSNRARFGRVLPLALVLAVSGWGLQRATVTRLTPPMPVPAPLRKQVLRGFMPFGSIGWVSNEQVVFSGRPVNRKQKDALYLWDQKQAPRLLLAHSPGGCIAQGVIRATQLIGGRKDKRFELRTPNFRPRLVSTRAAPAKSQFEPVSCTSIATPASLDGQQWKPLRRGQGFLVFDPRKETSRLRSVDHLSADQLTRKSTGIRMEPPFLPMAVHAAHDGSYLVFDLHQNPAQRERWIKTDERIIWRLDSRLQGTPLRVPAGTWVNPVGGTLAFLQARPGLLITSNNFGRNRQAGGAGLYLLPAGGAAQRLERGLVENAAVSPDGCRIAYGFRPHLDTGIPEGGPRLVVVDVCDTATSARP